MDACNVSEVDSRSNSLEVRQREGAEVLGDGLTKRVESVSLAALHRHSCIAGALGYYSAASRAIVNTFRTEELAHALDGASSVHHPGAVGALGPDSAGGQDTCGVEELYNLIYESSSEYTIDVSDTEVREKFIRQLLKGTKKAYGNGAYDKESCYKDSENLSIKLVTIPQKNAKLFETEKYSWIKASNEKIERIKGLTVDIWGEKHGRRGRDIIQDC